MGSRFREEPAGPFKMHLSGNGRFHPGYGRCVSMNTGPMGLSLSIKFRRDGVPGCQSVWRMG